MQLGPRSPVACHSCAPGAVPRCPPHKRLSVYLERGRLALVPARTDRHVFKANIVSSSGDLRWSVARVSFARVHCAIAPMCCSRRGRYSFPHYFHVDCEELGFRFRYQRSKPSRGSCVSVLELLSLGMDGWGLEGAFGKTLRHGTV